MKAHTKEFKEQIKKFGRELDSQITYTLNNEEVVLGKEQLNSITPHYEGDILKSVMKQLDIDSNVDIPVGTEVNYKFGVKTRSGKNLFDISIWKDVLLSKSTGTVSVDNNSITINNTGGTDIYTSSGMTITGQTIPNNQRKYLIEVKPNTTYTISFVKTSNDFSSAGSDSCYYSLENESYVVLSYGNLGNLGFDRTVSKTITTSNDTKYLSIRLGTRQQVCSITYSNIQIEEGDTATFFEEFGMYDYINYGNYIVYSTEKQEDTRSYKIVAYDKMLYAMKDYEKIENRNLFNKDEVILGKVWNGSGNRTRAYGYIEAVQGQQYTVSTQNSDSDLTVFVVETTTVGEAGTNIKQTTLTSTYTFTPRSNTKYIVIQFANTSNTTTQEIVNNAKVQIEEGNTATNYVPHFQYPITLKSYLEVLCDKIGLTLKDTNFVNYDKEITNELYLDSDGNSLNYTYRDVLDEIAGATASTICINEDDELEVRYINDTQGRNYFDNTKNKVSGVGFAGATETTISTGKKITYTTTKSSTSWAFCFYIIKDLTNYVGKKVRLKTNFTASGNNAPQYNIGLCNADGSNRLSKASSNRSGVLINFDVPELSGEQKYLCVWLYINANGTLELNDYVEYTNIMLTIDDSDMTFEPFGDTIDEEYLKDINVNFGEKYGPVNSIVFSRSAESDNIYRQDETSINENGLHEIKIIDNQILNGNTRENFIDGVFNQLNGFEYYANDFSSTGIAYYDLCDRYNVRVDDNIYSCIMMNDELDVSQGLEEKVHLDIPEKSETDYKKADTTDRRINQAYLIVNKQEQTIQGLVSKTSILDGGIYTKDQIDDLIVDAKNGVTNTFSEAGGNNIFRNTGLWFENSGTDSQQNPYEFWNGVVARTKEENASNMNALLLQNTTVYQEQLVSNNKYTVSFKYKKKLATATAKAIINSVEFNLSADEETEFIQVVEVNNQHIRVSFVCDMDEGFEIYDLMVNAGEVKLAYSQNQNETTTDTVNISKGITITSSDIDVKFKADADGIRTLDRNNDVLTKFTDVGMTTKRAEIQEKSEIVGTMWQEVGEQTWITKL